MAIRSLAAAQVAAAPHVTYALLAVASVGIAALAVRIVVGLARGTFLVRAQLPTPTS